MGSHVDLGDFQLHINFYLKKKGLWSVVETIQLLY